MLLSLLCGCSVSNEINIINFETLGLNLDNAVIKVEYKRGKETSEEKLKNLIKVKENRKVVIVYIVNANIPEKIILKDQSKSYSITFVKKIKEGLIYKFEKNLFLVSFDKYIFNFKSPWITDNINKI
jgi:hypothetical protein